MFTGLLQSQKSKRTLVINIAKISIILFVAIWLIGNFEPYYLGSDAFVYGVTSIGLADGSFVTTSFAALILLTIDVTASLLSLGMSFFLMTQHNFLGLNKYKAFMKNSIFRGITFLVIPLVLYFYFDVTGIILGFAISNLVASNYFFKIIKLKSFWKLKDHFDTLIHNFGVDISINFF